MPAKIRLWVEREGIFEDQRFYSVEYPFDDAPHVRAFAEKVHLYKRWVRDLFDGIRAGRPVESLPPFPEELVEKRYRGKGNAQLPEE